MKAGRENLPKKEEASNVMNGSMGRDKDEKA